MLLNFRPLHFYWVWFFMLGSVLIPVIPIQHLSISSNIYAENGIEGQSLWKQEANLFSFVVLSSWNTMYLEQKNLRFSSLSSPILGIIFVSYF